VFVFMRCWLQSLVETGLLSEKELQSCIVSDFNPIRVGFSGGPEVCVCSCVNGHVQECVCVCWVVCFGACVRMSVHLEAGSAACETQQS